MQDISSDIIARASQGDLAAFEEIYRQFASYVYNVAVRMLKNREDAEEVAQDVFMTMHKSLKEFRGESSLKTWVHRVTINRALNFLKKRSTLQSREVGLDPEFEVAGKPDDRHDKEHSQAIIDKLLGALTPDQRACIVLRNLEGFTYEQIAQSLKIDINAVRSRIKRARWKMLDMKKEVLSYEM